MDEDHHDEGYGWMRPLLKHTHTIHPNSNEVPCSYVMEVAAMGDDSHTAKSRLDCTHTPCSLFLYSSDLLPGLVGYVHLMS